jgi:hypothetical protein
MGSRGLLADLDGMMKRRSNAAGISWASLTKVWSSTSHGVREHVYANVHVTRKLSDKMDYSALQMKLQLQLFRKLASLPFRNF